MSGRLRQALGTALTLLALLPAAALPALAQQEVDLELVLLADASRSIDDGEIAFQRQGYAAAITHPDVLAVIRQGYLQRIAVTYVEWGDALSQDVVVDWTVIDGPEAAADFAERLLAAPRRATGPNAIGSALALAQGLIEANDISAVRRVIDFSADSAYSGGGPPIGEARASALAAGIVINGLAILCRDCDSGRPIDYDLEAAFASLITGGPGSFVVTADGLAPFAQAVRRKLILEIAGPGVNHDGPAAAAAEAAPIGRDSTPPNRHKVALK